MTDEIPAVPTPGEQPAAVFAPAPTPAPKKRLIWPWVLGGLGLLLVIAVAIGGAVFVGSILGGQSATSSMEQTVLAFDESYENADCEQLESITTEELRDQLVVDGYTCEDWAEIAESFTIDGEYTYDVVITSSSTEGDTGTVHSTETWIDADGLSQSAEFTYTLDNSSGEWIITEWTED